MKIYMYPDELLKQKCNSVTSFGPELHKILDEMLSTMKEANGIGLSANQVGYLMCMFIMLDKTGKVWEFINPQLIDKDGLQYLNEGCLSAPGVFVQIQRSDNITVKAQDRFGIEFTISTDGLEAVCIQHEMDHLNGEFFLDKTNRQQRRAALSKLGIRK